MRTPVAVPPLSSVPNVTNLATLLDLLDALETGRPADAVISGWLRGQTRLSEADRGAMIETAYALMRHHARIGWWLEQLGAADTARTRLLAWLALDGAPAETIAAQFGTKSGLAPLSEAERMLLVGLDGATTGHPDMPQAVRLECPSWAEAALRRRFGAAFELEMAAMLMPPPLDLRVNSLKTTREAVMADLGRRSLAAEAMALAPLGVRLPEKLSLANLPMLKAGDVEIQDEGSQLVAGLVDARPGDRVVDFCAGAGGKTLAIAAQMKNKGKIVACDVSEGRLKRAAERFRRAGVHNAETRLLASETDKWVKRHKLGFDRVLVDAPCSGTGTWRRNPDARWRDEDEAGLAGLIALQAKILASAARLVRPGGRLVYATCSLLEEENQTQVEAFLSSHPHFSRVPLPVAAPTLASLGETDLALTPARHNTDGFYAAVLQRAEMTES